MEAYSDCLRLELAYSGVKVSIIEPAGFKTGEKYDVFVAIIYYVTWINCISKYNSCYFNN